MGRGQALIVLDTHAWLWWANEQERLSRRASEAIEAADIVGVCAISCFELSLLVARGKVEVDRDLTQWIAHALAHERFEALPVTHQIATDAGLLGREGFHGDPADRIIYATARAHDARLVTKDQRLRRFDNRLTLW